MTVLRKAMAGAFVLGLLVAQLGLSGTAQADSSGVNSYIELSATKPASGCTIDGSFEVRSDGYPVAGVEVFIGLYVGTDLISSDSALTDDNGVTYLSIDPSAADGADAWIDVTLNDTYWWGTASYPGAGGTCYDGALNANKSGQIAGAPSSTASTYEMRVFSGANRLLPRCPAVVIARGGSELMAALKCAEA